MNLDNKDMKKFIKFTTLAIFVALLLGLCTSCSQKLDEVVELADNYPVSQENPTTKRGKLIYSAHSYLGTPYLYGGKTKEALDCSGFTKLAYKDIGVNLPDGSFNQEGDSAKPFTSEEELKPGDLLFYRFGDNKNVSHIAMYYGDGCMIGTGTPGTPPSVSIYPITIEYNLMQNGVKLTYRHIKLSDES